MAPILAAAKALISHSGPVGQQQRDPIAAPRRRARAARGPASSTRVAQRGVGQRARRGRRRPRRPGWAAARSSSRAPSVRLRGGHAQRPVKRGAPSLAMRGHALVDVAAPLERVAKGVGQRARLAEAAVEARVDDALGAADGDRPAGRDARGQRLRLGQQAVARMHGQHQPQPLQLGGVQLAAGAHDLQRTRPADEHRQAARDRRRRESRPTAPRAAPTSRARRPAGCRRPARARRRPRAPTPLSAAITICGSASSAS